MYKCFWVFFNVYLIHVKEIVFGEHHIKLTEFADLFPSAVFYLKNRLSRRKLKKNP